MDQDVVVDEPAFFGVDLEEMTFTGPLGVIKLSDATVAVLRENSIDCTEMVINGGGYPCFRKGLFGRKTTHSVVAKTRKGEDMAYWEERGYTIENTTWHVAHLDNNRVNFNIENLMTVPDEVNRWSQSRRGAYRGGAKYNRKVTFDGVTMRTRRVPTVAEAEHAHDCLKMTMCPERAREFIFKHGLIRPNEFIGEYIDASSLSGRYEMLYKTKPLVSSSRKRKRWSGARLVDVAEWEPHIHTAIEASLVKFDDEIDGVVEYYGRTVKFQFIAELDDFESHLKDKEIKIGKDRYGYVNVNNTGFSRLVLGLKKGQHAQKACHGPGGHLDNRKRTLRIDTHSGNMRDVSHKTAKSASTERGVSRTTTGGNWRIRITIHEVEYHCANTESHDEAVRISRLVHGIASDLEKLDHTGIRAAIREAVRSK